MSRGRLLNTNYLLIDYENVQPKSLSALDGRPFKVIVFLGAKQKVDVDLANAMQKLGSDGSSTAPCWRRRSCQGKRSIARADR